MLKKKKNKSHTLQRYSESFIVTRTSFNQALSSKSHESGNLPKKEKEYNTHHSTQQTTTK